jgi:uncharacterized protein
VTLVTVVDTNVVVSALLTADSDSPTCRILDAMLSGDLRFVLSDRLLAEYRGVLLRPAIVARHGLTEADVDAILEAIVVNAGWRECAEAEAGRTLAATAAPSGDAHVVALLDAEPAAVLVTGDRALLESLRDAGRGTFTPAAFAAKLGA